MVCVSPFSISQEDCTEIRQIARQVFAGVDPLRQEETGGLYRKWKCFFDLFNTMIDVRYGNFLHLPFSGGAAEQPCKTMETLFYLQGLFRKKIDDDQKRAMARIRAPRRR